MHPFAHKNPTRPYTEDENRERQSDSKIEPSMTRHNCGSSVGVPVENWHGEDGLARNVIVSALSQASPGKGTVPRRMLQGERALSRVQYFSSQSCLSCSRQRYFLNLWRLRHSIRFRVGWCDCKSTPPRSKPSPDVR